MSIVPLKVVKLFVASGSELKDERRDTILVFNRIGKYFPSLKLDPVMWETDIPSGSCYDKNRIQDEINPLLDDCDIVLVLFYSKTGRFTLEEYQQAHQKNKKILKDDLTLYLNRRYSFFGSGETLPLSNLREILYRGSQDYYQALRALTRNPMMLTLYAVACEVQKTHGQSIHCSFKEPVETPGELLWNFMEAQVARLPERLAEDEKKIAYYIFLLKFFLPGLGYEMEKAGLFDFSEQQLYDCMELLCRRFGRDDFFNTYTQFYEFGRELPVGDCTDSMERRERAAKLKRILCRELSMLVGEGNSFRFLHQHFRDFFAAVHILNELEMGKSQGDTAVLRERRLDFNIRWLLGELEGEYRSKPYLTGRLWRIDIDKENRLYKALEGMRGKFGAEVGYGVWNIVETWKDVRGELSGADLSGLDLCGVMLNGVCCSRFDLLNFSWGSLIF